MYWLTIITKVSCLHILLNPPWSPLDHPSLIWRGKEWAECLPVVLLETDEFFIWYCRNWREKSANRSEEQRTEVRRTCWRLIEILESRGFFLFFLCIGMILNVCICSEVFHHWSSSTETDWNILISTEICLPKTLLTCPSFHVSRVWVFRGTRQGSRTESYQHYVCLLTTLPLWHHWSEEARREELVSRNVHLFRFETFLACSNACGSAVQDWNRSFLSATRDGH